MMATEPKSWVALMARLREIAASGLADAPDLPEPPGWLVLSAASLIGQLRDGGATPPDRISYVVAGMIHLEWWTPKVHMVMAVDGVREAELACIRNSGESKLERYHW